MICTTEVNFNMQILKIDVTASTVAWYGAIVATLGGIKALNDILNDRGRLKVTFQTDMMVVAAPGQVSEGHVAINVTNKSKRPAKITHVGLRRLPNWDRALLWPNEIPRVLTEENPATVYVKEQEGLDLDNLWFVYVINARGKEYHWYKKRTGRLKWWQYKLRNKLRLHKRRSRSTNSRQQRRH
jgi:hypothetical protein